MTAETAAWEEIIEWLNDWPDDLLGKIRHAGEILDWALAGVPSLLAERARKLWDDICRYTNEIWAWFRDEFLPGVWAPVTLWQASSSWTADVLSRVSSAEGSLDPAMMLADDTWHGPAARAYGQVAKGQQAAANAVTETVGGINEPIRDLSLGMGALYVSMAALLLKSAIEIEGGTATLFGVVTIPAGLAAIAAGLLTAIAAIGGLTAGIKFVGGEALTALSGLRKAFNDSRGLDDGAWPKATAELNDASLTDGDRSGWTYYGDRTN